MNALVGFQLLDDGTPASIGLIIASSVALFIGTGYIALDTAFNWTGHFASSTGAGNDNRNIGLYVLYQLFPLVCLVLFYAFEAVLVLRVLGEFRPMRMSSQSQFSEGTSSLTLFLQFILPARLCCSLLVRSFNM